MNHTRLMCWLAAAALLPLLNGCYKSSCCGEKISMDTQGDAAIDIALTEAAMCDSIKEAVIQHHVLYSYHFIFNAAELNDLGRRDVSLLAYHYRKYPGSINIRRGDASADLYQSRVEAVREALADLDVDLERISVEDTLPAGDGMPSHRVIKILVEGPRIGEYGSTAIKTDGAK